jgi:hypothetical protein
MNAKTLLPILIALHVAAAALIVDGLGLKIDEPSTARPDSGWQVVERNAGAGCMPEFASGDFARVRFEAIRESNPPVALRQACGSIR